MQISVGIKGRAETVVSDQNTAIAMGSGQVPVFATPSMIALMEQAASTSLLPFLDEGQGTVGVHMDVTHDSATPVGMKVWAESEVTAVSDRKVSFTVLAYDEAGLIGQGTHERVCITADRFVAKAQKKLDR